jgi:lipopolysaccharide/colanic/teichoic acid biosynthesis glycosyltransferase
MQQRSSRCWFGGGEIVLINRNYRAPNRCAVRFLDCNHFSRFGEIAICCLLIGFTLPLMAIIALLLKLEGTGPVLARQKRLDKDGKEIALLRFRTEPQHGYADRTALGETLYNTRLDELPKLFNVVRGEMSLGRFLTLD